MALKFASAQTVGKTLDFTVTEGVATGNPILESQHSQPHAASNATGGPNGQSGRAIWCGKCGLEPCAGWK
jgi:hypothetical protein